MKIGVTDRVVEVGEFEHALTSQGAEFVFLNSLDESDYKGADLAELDALLVWHARITEKTASRLKNCKIVVRYGIGYDQIDVDALTRAGIRFSNNPSYCIEEVADTAVAMIINATRGVTRHGNLSRQYAGNWQENNLATWRSRGRNVGLIGLGKIGIATALRLKSFGFNLFAYDPYVDQGLGKSLNISFVQHLDDLLGRCDIVSFHCPLTQETAGIIDAGFLKKMKPNGILVNTARGKLLKSFNVLKEHMQAHRQFQAFLDVLPTEPPAEDELISSWRKGEDWLSERLTINPHNAYYSDLSRIDMRRDVAETVRLALYDGIFRNTVN